MILSRLFLQSVWVAKMRKIIEFYYFLPPQAWC
jgi:hypothetical protein